MGDLAVLLMAYGTPNSEDEVEEYLANIRKGRKPSAGEIQELKERYRKIGSRSPLLEITEAQASELEKILVSRGVRSRVFFGMKHWHPYIREVVPRIIKEGFERLVGLVLAPHYSRMSTGGYQEALLKAVGEFSSEAKVAFIASWYDNPRFHEAVAEKINAALARFNGKAHVLFTAHSLPARILEDHDPYPNQIVASCEAVAKLANIGHWSLAYQSAGQPRGNWLGPHIHDVLAQLAGHAQDFDRNVLVVPIGFVSDHLEILYDIDIEATDFAETHGLNLMRTESLNTSPKFISALADIVSGRL